MRKRTINSLPQRSPATEEAKATTPYSSIQPMEFDPFNISTLKNQIAESEKTIADLKAELERKNEERTRMEKQIIKLTENIANKDQNIDDLEHKIKILEESIEGLLVRVNEKEENKKMNEFLKSELEKRDKEVVLLTRERDMLNWKLIHEGTPETDVEQERNTLRDKNLKLVSENTDLANELDKLSVKLDQLAQRNSNLTSELEKRSKFAEQLQADFENALKSRSKIITEVESLKQKLSDVQKSLRSSSPTPSRRIKNSATERPSLIPRRSKISNTISKSHRPTPAFKPSSSSSKSATPATQLTPQSSMDTTPSSASTLFRNVEESIVRKIVHNIQSSFSCAPVLPPNSKPYLLVQPQSSITARFPRIQDDVEDQTRKIAVESIRQMLESKLLGNPTGQVSELPLDSKYLMVKSAESTSSMKERDRKNHGL